MPTASPWTRERALFLAGSLVLAALPFALVTFPPSADLPQQAAQIRLLEEQLGLAAETTPRELYEIRWWAPNNLVYVVFFATARVLEPIAAARTALAMLALAVVLAIHELARRRARPPELAMLAATLVFSSSLYWGFVGFLLGAAVFLLVLERALRAPDPAHPVRDVAVLTLVATLLYAAHSLWLPALAAALVAGPLVARLGGGEPRPLRRELPRALALVPALAHAAYWFPRLAAERAEAGFDMEARWRPLDERLARLASGDSVYGGLEGLLEPGMMALLVLWVSAGLLPREGREARGGIDRALLAVAGALALFVLVGPDKYANTIEMNGRYGFVAAALAILAAPRPPVREQLARALPALAALAFGVTTAAAWVAVDRVELAGLEEAVRTEPRPARVLGLDFVQRSEVVDGAPFLQAFAWRQALHGGELNFSFAEHKSGIVGMRDVRRVPWTPGLEWTAERVTSRDLEHFDLVVLGGAPEQHEGFARQARTEIAGEGRWRLHRLVR